MTATSLREAFAPWRRWFRRSHARVQAYEVLPDLLALAPIGVPLGERRSGQLVLEGNGRRPDDARP